MLLLRAAEESQIWLCALLLILQLTDASSPSPSSLFPQNCFDQLGQRITQFCYNFAVMEVEGEFKFVIKYLLQVFPPRNNFNRPIKGLCRRLREGRGSKKGIWEGGLDFRDFNTKETLDKIFKLSNGLGTEIVHLFAGRLNGKTDEILGIFEKGGRSDFGDLVLKKKILSLC